ncbi:MAG: PAS domain S-box protein [Phycisphaerae bacterium]
MILGEDGEPVDYRFLDINPAFQRMTGLGREIIGRTVREVLPQTEDHWIQRFGQVALTGQPARFEDFSRPMGRWYNVTAYRPTEGQIACIFEDTTERHETAERLRSIEWLLTRRANQDGLTTSATPAYGDLSQIGTVHEIRDAVGPETLRHLVSDFLDLLGTSSAVYEKNGDYALGIFSSTWCRSLDLASRNLCDTEDNREALACGKWLCHESCWSHASLPAIQRGEPVDIACHGGIRLYTVPIFAGDEVVGAINFGYGSPPEDPRQLSAIARRYGLPEEQLVARAAEYQVRPAFLVDVAKHRLHTTARIIGEAVLRQRLEKQREQSYAELAESREELRRNERYLRALLETAGDGIMTLSRSGEITQANDAYCRMLGYRPEEIIGRRIDEVDVSDNATNVARRMERLERVGNELFETVHRGKDGRTFPVEISVTYLAEPEDRFVCFCRDLTDRKAAEMNLRLSETRWRSYVQNAPFGVFIADLEGLYREVNPAAERISGYSGEELRNMGIADLIAPESRDSCLDHFRRAVETGHAQGQEAFLRKDGEIRWWSVDAVKLSEERILGFVQDVTERRRAQQELHESKDRFERMLAVVPDMISIQDPDMNLLYCNWQGFAAVPQERRVTGEKCYRVLRELDAPCPDCRARQVLETRQPYHEEVDLPEGHRVDVRVIPLLDVDGNIEMFMEWVRDTTDRRIAEQQRHLLEEQLAQAQKLESVGRLAGGVAHDFNNMLTVILGCAETAMLDLPAGNPLRGLLEEIHLAGHRSADLTRQLLAFARKQTVAPQVLDLNETVEGMLKMLRRLIGEGIDLFWHPGRNIWPVHMDPGQIQQILANLCVNARDAIGDVGSVTIETANIRLDAHPEDPSALPRGDCVKLSVCDNGRGMDAETRASVFEPFFTTKGVGEGTGLGLATVYGIVRQNDGDISVRSQPGEGSEFTILLPRHTEEDEAPESATHPPNAIGGSETILFVEDEQSILRLGTSMLESLGYRVLPCSSPTEAIRQAEEHDGEIDLLFTDVIMPEMNGRNLYHQVAGICPHIRCVFTSGYPANAIADHGVLEDGVQFIEKPYSLRQLSQRLREALGA